MKWYDTTVGQQEAPDQTHDQVGEKGWTDHPGYPLGDVYIYAALLIKFGCFFINFFVVNGWGSIYNIAISGFFFFHN